MDTPFLERLDELERRFKRFRMEGTDEVLVGGSLKSGYTVNVTRPSEVVAAAPVGNCTVDWTFTSTEWTETQTGLAYPVVGHCGGDALGWTTDPWEVNCATCSSALKLCNNSAGSCVCGIRMEWRERADPTNQYTENNVEWTLNKLVGDSVLADGWYIWASATHGNFPPFSDFCFWETASCGTPPCTCVFLGGDSIWTSTFTVNLTLPRDPISPFCSTPATLSITFHPCTPCP